MKSCGRLADTLNWHMTEGYHEVAQTATGPRTTHLRSHETTGPVPAVGGLSVLGRRHIQVDKWSKVVQLSPTQAELVLMRAYLFS